jgi:hypothetical protein
MSTITKDFSEYSRLSCCLYHADLGDYFACPHCGHGPQPWPATKCPACNAPFPPWALE